jgi:hypothetical protein
MRILAAILILTLSACTTVPVIQKFPQAPGPQVQVGCPELKKLPENAVLTDVAKTVANNYTEYYTCAAKLDAWITWYTQQKIIFEGLGK